MRSPVTCHLTVVVVDEDELLDEAVEQVAELVVRLVHQLLHGWLAGVVQRVEVLREEYQQVADTRVSLELYIIIVFIKYPLIKFDKILKLTFSLLN